MKDKTSQMDYEWRNSLGSKDNDAKVKALTDEIERLRILISKITESMTWGNSVVKVVFRDEFYEEKYRLKVENFFKEILDTDEHCILNSQIYDNTEQEFIKNHHSFHAEKSSKHSLSGVKTQNNIPIYSSEFEDVLHCDEPEPEEQNDKDKPQTMTCFNCLGDHHMKKCPDRIDRLRVAANKKEVLSENTRYHEEERKNAMKPGNISCELRLAMGLKSDQLSQHIYNMRVIGYPPGWMDDAVFETSGLFLYDGDSKATTTVNKSEDLSKIGKKYDSSKFVEYPGFNCPVPSDIKDDWQALGMLPLQPHQQLSETLKADNTINSSNLCKRKHPASTDDDTKKVRNGTNGANETLIDWSPENSSTPKKTESPSLNVCNGTPLNKGLGISLSISPGTPILTQGNCYQKLPDANKFAQGITEHLPFENLPESVGKFDKIRGVLCDVQKKLQNIKKGS